MRPFHLPLILLAMLVVAYAAGDLTGIDLLAARATLAITASATALVAAMTPRRARTVPRRCSPLRRS